MYDLYSLKNRASALDEPTGAASTIDDSLRRIAAFADNITLAEVSGDDVALVIFGSNTFISILVTVGIFWLALVGAALEFRLIAAVIIGGCFSGSAGVASADVLQFSGMVGNASSASSTPGVFTAGVGGSRGVILCKGSTISTSALQVPLATLIIAEEWFSNIVQTIGQVAGVGALAEATLGFALDRR